MCGKNGGMVERCFNSGARHVALGQRPAASCNPLSWRFIIVLWGDASANQQPGSFCLPSCLGFFVSLLLALLDPTSALIFFISSGSPTHTRTQGLSPYISQSLLPLNAERLLSRCGETKCFLAAIAEGKTLSLTCEFDSVSRAD